jgi:hypothetical protein
MLLDAFFQALINDPIDDTIRKEQEQEQPPKHIETIVVIVEFVVHSYLIT